MSHHPIQGSSPLLSIAQQQQQQTISLPSVNHKLHLVGTKLTTQTGPAASASVQSSSGGVKQIRRRQH